MESTIVRAKRKTNFTIMAKDGFQEKEMSWKAKGILAYLLTLPDDWKLYLNDLKTRSKDGRDSTARGVKELIDFGYIKREQKKDDSNRFAGYEYTVSDEPVFLSENEEVENEKPVNGKSENEKCDTTKEEINIVINNTKEEEEATTAFDKTNPVSVYERMVRYYKENPDVLEANREFNFPKCPKYIEDLVLKDLAKDLAAFHVHRCDIYNDLHRGHINSRLGKFFAQAFKNRDKYVEPEVQIASVGSKKYLESVKWIKFNYPSLKNSLFCEKSFIKLDTLDDLPNYRQNFTANQEKIHSKECLADMVKYKRFNENVFVAIKDFLRMKLIERTSY